MDRKRRRRDEPAVESGFRDNSLTAKKAGIRRHPVRGSRYCRHAFTLSLAQIVGFQSSWGHRLRSRARLLNQLFDSKANFWPQAFPTGAQVLLYSSPHSRIPELLKVIKDSRNSFVLSLAREKLADLIGHHNEFVSRHAWGPFL
jgi:hypothetical protein